jgi:hypothetical protein
MFKYYPMVLALVIPSTVSAVEYQHNTWDIGLSASRYEFQDSKNSIIGNSGAFQIGRGWIGDRWRFGATVDILMGPYTEIRSECVRTDFFGTGLSATSYFSVTGPLRSPSGSWGLSAGATYFDIVGRSVQNGDADKDGNVITNLTMRASTFMATAGIFRAWMVPKRPEGNTPDLLLTRIEGYMLGISGAYPIQSSYSVKYDIKNQGASGPTGEPRSRSDRGDLEGYSISATFSAMLGY